MAQNYVIRDHKDVSNAGISTSLSFTSSAKDTIGCTCNLGYWNYEVIAFEPAGIVSKVVIRDHKNVSNAGISDSLSFTSSAKDTQGSSGNLGYWNFEEVTSFTLFVVGTRVTQIVAEVLAEGDPLIRVTQTILEVLSTLDINIIGITGVDLLLFGSGGSVDIDPLPDIAIVTQHAVELVVQAEAGTRVSQTAIEVLSKYSTFGVRVTQNATEVIAQCVSRALVSQLVTELILHGIGGARSTQQTVEIVAFNDESNLGSRVTHQALECLVKIEPAVLPTTTTTSTTTTSSTTTNSTTTTTLSTTATFTFTFTIPDPKPIGSDRYPFVLPIPIDNVNALSVQNVTGLPTMEFNDGGPVSVVGQGFFMGAFHPFDETSRSLFAVYVPPKHGVGGP